MSNLKRNYNRFVFKHRDKGIPNLMLWICASNAVVFVLWYLFKLDMLSLLNFDADKILHGQLWRLFSYVFTFASGGSFLGSSILGAVISISFYYWVGRMLENTWGTLRFNLYYLAGVLLSDAFAIVLQLIFHLCPTVSVHYLNLSMFLAVATLIPDQRVYIYMIIPVKMKWLAWVDLGLSLISVVTGVLDAVYIWFKMGSYMGTAYLLFALFPLVSLLNYFLFFGKDIANVLPRWMTRKRRQKPKRVVYTQAQPNPDWAKNYRSPSGERPYRHKCTVCGRTDTDCPGLEFRYCSRCAGYFCYCIDHINNHTHVQ